MLATVPNPLMSSSLQSKKALDGFLRIPVHWCEVFQGRSSSALAFRRSFGSSPAHFTIDPWNPFEPLEDGTHPIENRSVWEL